jgi:hypothetical protein
MVKSRQTVAKTACLLCLWLLVMLMGGEVAIAANLVGRVGLRVDNSQRVIPLRDVEAVLYRVDRNNTRTAVDISVTDSDGLYFLYDVPQGRYVIVINGRQAAEFTVDTSQRWLYVDPFVIEEK